MNRKSWVLGSALLAACLAITGCQKKPAADFSAGMTSGTVPLTVQFTDMSTPGTTPITAWHWLFGDGSESTAQDPSHVYTTAGTYNVSLEVTSAAGNDTALKLSFIAVTPPDAGDTRTITLPGDVPLEMVWIPAGTFTMGSPDTETGRGMEEGPQHAVTLNGFWMGRHELTKRQWQAVMGTAPWSGRADIIADPDSPAVWLSWEAARSFIAAANSATGQTFRLPTEAEWEYACRAGAATRFYWGDDQTYVSLSDYAWWDGNAQSAGQHYAHVVAQKLPNAWGLCDMSGNAWECCQDRWHEGYAGAPSDGSAWELPTDPNRVIRGGCWANVGQYHRSAVHGRIDPTETNSAVGLRPAL